MGSQVDKMAKKNFWSNFFVEIDSRWSKTYFETKISISKKKLPFWLDIREADSGGGDPKFSKMVALQRPQNRKMVALQRPKFAQKGLFLEIFAAPSAPRPILSFRTSFYIKFYHIWQLFSKFRHFRKIFTKMTDFQKIFWNLDPKNTQKITFYCIFRPLFFENW